MFPFQLPAELYAVVEAIYGCGLKERETAQLLGITRHQVRTRHEQAMKIIEREWPTTIADGAGI